MPPSLSNYQNVFRIEKNDPKSKGIETRATKRNRPPVSCSACRIRKLKCDRRAPCSACSKRGPTNAASCNYFGSDRKDRSRHDRAMDSKIEAHIRLQKLEEMVTGILQTTNKCHDNAEDVYPTSRTADQTLESLSLDNPSEAAEGSFGSRGHLEVNGSETTYAGATHCKCELLGAKMPSFEHQRGGKCLCFRGIFLFTVDIVFTHIVSGNADSSILTYRGSGTTKCMCIWSAKSIHTETNIV